MEKTIVYEAFDSHIILYCKRHYKSNNLLEDLKKIWVVRCGLEYDKNDNRIIKPIMDGLYRIIKPIISDPVRFQENMHEYLTSWIHKDMEWHERLISYYVSVIANIQVFDNIKYKTLVKLVKPRKEIFNRIIDGKGKYEDYDIIVNLAKEEVKTEKALTWWNRDGFNGSLEQRDLGLKYFPEGFVDFEQNVCYIWEKEFNS